MAVVYNARMLFWRKHIPLVVILIAFVVLAVSYSVVNPLYESTDEIRHYHYVRHLAETHTLPVQDPALPSTQSHHPPLFYALAALVSGWVQPDHPLYFDPAVNPHWGFRYWEVSVDNKNQYLHGADEAFPYQGDALKAHLARWVNVLIGLGTVWLTYRLGQVIWPDQPALALGAMAFVAFNPMFLYMSGAINNDVIAALSSAAVLVACAEIIARGITLRRAAVLGGLYGLAILSKFNVAFILALIELALLADAWHRHAWRRRHVRELARTNVVVLGMALLISGWWFARNQILYGEPTGVQRVTVLWGMRDPRTSLTLVLSELPYLWTSLWGRFGYGQIPMPDWTYTGLKIIAGLALIGLIARAVQVIRTRSRLLALQLGLLVATVVSFAGVLFGYMLISPAGAMGRFLFPALPALGVLLTYGLSALIPARWTQGLAIVCLVVMASLSLVGLTGVLAPAYARPARLTEKQLAAISHPTQAIFGNQAKLLGYDVNADRVQPGGELILTVYWQALAAAAPDLTTFVGLLSRDGPVIAQRDTYPGLGNFHGSLWRAGDTFSDRYRIVLDPWAYAPDETLVLLALYTPSGGRLPVSQLSGTSLGTAITLTRVSIAPLAGALDATSLGTTPLGTTPYPNPVRVNFDNEMALLGYDVNARTVRPGEAITLTLYWQITRPTQDEYRVLAHVAGKEKYQKWAEDDGMPYVSPKRTWRWTVGQVYQETRPLRLAPDTPPGMYPIELGLYTEPNNKRLAVLAQDGRQIGDTIVLTYVLVTAQPAVEPP